MHVHVKISSDGDKGKTTLMKSICDILEKSDINVISIEKFHGVILDGELCDIAVLDVSNYAEVM